MFKLTVRAVVTAAAGLMIVAGSATGAVVRTRVQGPSSADLGGLLGLNGWDRVIMGARARAMGGASLALPGDFGSFGANPAALAFVTAPQLTAESRYQFGSSTASGVPASIMVFGLQAPVSNYSPGIAGTYSYNNLSYGMPVLLLGRRAGVGLAYRRMVDFDNGDETRFRVRVAQGQADLGIGLNYKGGIDAFSPTLAICLNDRLSLGGAINFMSGRIEADGNEGVTSFGAVIVRGSLAYHENVYGTSIDLGAQYKPLDNLTLAGVLLPGHDLDFKDGWDRFHPLKNPNDVPPANDLYMERDLLPHTLSVPAKYGAGMTYRLAGGRITLAADYWNRAWSKATITQDSLYAEVLYRVPITVETPISPADSVILHVTNVPVTRNARLKDTHHFRFGAEWMLKDSDNGGIRIPIRVGFRREPRTFSNVDTAAYNQNIYLAMRNAAADSSASELTRLVSDLYQNGAGYLVGDKVPANVITFGTGFRLKSFSVDLALARTTYTVTRVLFGAFADPTQYQPDGLPAMLMPVREKRSQTEFTITTTLRF